MSNSLDCKDMVSKIQEEPWNLDLRLVYADWLEEHQQYDRARVVRERVRNQRICPYVPCHVCGGTGSFRGNTRDAILKPCVFCKRSGKVVPRIWIQKSYLIGKTVRKADGRVEYVAYYKYKPANTNE